MSSVILTRAKKLGTCLQVSLVAIRVQSLRRAYGKGDAFCIALSSFNDFYNVSVLLRQNSSANAEQKENWISTKINAEAGAVQVASIVFWPCCKA
ncbi:unnamed protein product [Camellia sinensis]